MPGEDLEAVVGQVPSQAEAHRELGELYSGPLGDPAKVRAHVAAGL